jgi:putative flippase GtrA
VNYLNYRQYLKLALRHSIVSLSSSLIEFSLFIFFYSYLNFNLFFSHGISFSSAFIVGLFGHSYLTFLVGRIHKRNFYFFLIQCFFAFILGYMILKYFLFLKINPLISKLVQLGIIFFYNILFGKHITFKQR